MIDVADQADSAGEQEHGADTASGEALDTIGEFVVNVAGGYHGLFTLWPGPVLDPVEDSLLAFMKSSAVTFSFLAVAFSGFLGDSSSHSKASECWNSDDVFPPPLFQILRGFSSFFSGFSARKKISRLFEV
jgi:hypothetical protein